MINQTSRSAGRRALQAIVVVAAVTVGLGVRSTMAAEPGLELIPASVDLTGLGSTTSILVEKTADVQRVGQVTSGIKWSTDDSAIATVSDGEVTAVGNGSTTLRATVDGRKLTAKVTVHKAGAALSPSFRNHVLAVLAKAGCNSGACHGALAGKGGFRLSLRGFDPATDYQT
ncbi:MAG: hypothetical protein ACI93T_004759, partial [Porticoccaceae bacterium]